jgi:RecB family endonuclease NucS
LCQGRIESAGCVSIEEIPPIIRKFFKTATITIFAKCSVSYSGRASSEAGEAWRLIIIKEDGTVLIHERTGREPINWQPKAFVTSYLGGHGEAVIKAVRSKPREVLQIRITGDAFIAVARLGSGKFVLEGSEENITRELALNPSAIEEGAELVSREVSTPHGRIDLILRSRDGELIIVEVKRSLADVSAVYQLKRYVEYYKSIGVRVRGVIASPKVSPAAAKLLARFGFKHVRV